MFNFVEMPLPEAQYIYKIQFWNKKLLSGKALNLQQKEVAYA